MIGDWRPYAELHPGPDHTVVGDLRVLPGVGGEGIAPRDLLVLLPDGAETTGQRYPVLYFHDGQNLFDVATSFAGEWRVDETMAALRPEGLEAIVVGVPNGQDQRITEYTPYPAPAGFSGPEMGAGPAHLRYLVDVVKPLVDAAFPTRTDPAATGILGSSLGGLMSAWAGWERPDVFGLIGAMSPAFVEGQHRLIEHIRTAPKPALRMYVDIGTREGNQARWDRVFPLQSWRWVREIRMLRGALEAAGFRGGVDLRYVEDPRAIHHESAWARRLPDALRFLLADARPVREPEAGAPGSA